MSAPASAPRAAKVPRETMRAARIVAPGRVEIVEAPIPQPGPGQVRVRLEGCGVCASNVPPFEGREWFSYPMAPGALGHEGWGRVDAVGEGAGPWKEGDRVAFLGQSSYAEFDVADAAALVRIPEGGEPFPGEPLGCALNIFRRSGIEEGSRVAVVGVGFLGSLLIQLAKGRGAKVLALARKPFAQDTARQMGADAVAPLEQPWRAVEEAKRIFGERLCDVVIEATGKQEPLDVAAELTSERGRLVIAGFHQDGPRQVNMFLWNWRGLDVINAHERDPSVYVEGIREAVRAVEEGRLDPRPLYTHHLPLERLQEALALTRDRPDGFMKALVRMEA